MDTRPVLGVGIALLLAGCRAADPQPIAAGSAGPLAIASPTGRLTTTGLVAFVADTAGANDYGPNALALGGLRAEARRLGMAEPAVVAATSADGYVTTVDGAANGARLVVGQGSGLLAAFEAAAAAHPDVSLALLDATSSSTSSNLRTVAFGMDDVVHQAGRLAAAVSARHTVAFAGGKDTTEARRLAEAFGRGAEGARGLTAFAGSDDNQADAKRLAEGLIGDQDADVLLAASFPGGLGTIAAASQRRVLVIGMNSDRYAVAPNAVLTSIVKRSDLAAATALTDFKGGTFRGGTQVLGSAEGAVTFAPLRDLAARVPPALGAELKLRS